VTGSLASPGRTPIRPGTGAAAGATSGSRVREHAGVLTVSAVMLAWDGALFLLVRERFVEFRLGRYDLGNMVQAVWSTAHGRPLEVTDGQTGAQLVRLGSHVDPILAALAPLWLVAPTPLALVAVQVVAVGLGALPVLWLARHHGASERAATLLALAYLAYPWTAWAACDVFHPVTLAIPLFLFSVWFLETRRLAAFGVCAVLVLATGELMGLSLAALGVWYALARRERRVGLAMAGVGVAWTLVALYVVVPHFSGGSSVFYGAFESVGGSPAGVLQTAATDPLAIATALSQGRDVLYLLVLALPVGAAFLLAPGMSAVALPALAVNLLSGFSAMTYPHLHYTAAVLPFLFAAIAIGLGRVSLEARRFRVAVVVLGLCVAGTVAAGPWPGQVGAAPSWYWGNAEPPERLETLRRAVAVVPDGAPVASTNRIGSHLAARRYAYTVRAIGAAEWIVVDVTDSWMPRQAGGEPDPAALRELRARLERSGSWQRVFDEDGVQVFRKVGT
jgi:uncharacterized membrane protein